MRCLGRSHQLRGSQPLDHVARRAMARREGLRGPVSSTRQGTRGFGSPALRRPQCVRRGLQPPARPTSADRSRSRIRCSRRTRWRPDRACRKAALVVGFGTGGRVDSRRGRRSRLSPHGQQHAWPAVADRGPHGLRRLPGRDGPGACPGPPAKGMKERRLLSAHGPASPYDSAAEAFVWSRFRQAGRE
jgi:hypothetical protein